MGSQPPAVNTKNRRRLQTELTGRTNFGKDQMAGIAAPLISTQHRLIMHGCECPRAESGFHPRCGHHAATRPSAQARQTESAPGFQLLPSAARGARAGARTPDGSGPRPDNVETIPGPSLSHQLQPWIHQKPSATPMNVLPWCPPSPDIATGPDRGEAHAL